MFWGRVVITPQKKENTGDDTFKGVLKFSLQTNQKEQHQATERVILMNSWVAVTQISPPPPGLRLCNYFGTDSEARHLQYHKILMFQHVLLDCTPPCALCTISMKDPTPRIKFGQDIMALGGFLGGCLRRKIKPQGTMCFPTHFGVLCVFSTTFLQFCSSPSNIQQNSKKHF